VAIFVPLANAIFAILSPVVTNVYAFVTMFEAITAALYARKVDTTIVRTLPTFTID
jgi:hypothetical protein